MSETPNTAEQPDLINASADDLKAMGLPPSFTLDSLGSFLTEEEVEALTTGDDPLVIAAEDNGDGKGDDDDDDDDDEGQGAGDAGTTPAATEEKPDPVLTAIDTTGQQAVIDGAKQERRELLDKYNDGELSDDEYQAQLDALDDKVVEAKTALKEATAQRAQQEEAYRNAWFDRAGEVMEANPVFKDATPQQALGGYSVAQVFDEACRHVTGQPQFAGLTLAQKAETAAKIAREYYKQQTGQELAAPKGKGGGKPKANDGLPERPTGPRPKAIQTLGNVTAATDTEINDGRFASIDRNNNGLQAERDYGRMSDAEKEAYLAGL